VSKLVVSGSSRESRIALVGATGNELLVSETFTEPRARGARLRALKKILGTDVTIEDSTTTTRRVAATDNGVVVTAKAAAKTARKKTTPAVRPRRHGIAPAVETPPARKTSTMAKRTAKSAPSA
jgi:hypothetical protein